PARPSPTPAITPSPAPTPAPTASPTPARSVFADQLVVAYYGNPYSPIMGILGEHDTPELIRRLRIQAARYQALVPDKKVIPALHLVYAVAQANPGDDGSYLYHMPDELVEEYIDVTRREGMLLVIDLQMGRADPVAEVERVRHWLRNEHVHLAIDPEFTMPPGERPGVDLGSMDATTINAIQDVLQTVALEAGTTTNKALIVHQFQADMITNKAAIRRDRERVDVVIDLDGWGPPWSKQEKYQALGTDEPVEYTGFKLFYRWDQPMLSEEQVVALVPRPSVIVYQ
ncbi:MAG TPA: hypothetical protein VFV93_09455, partial [Thermomicrobiales bacterium]|nr:hypothetical protein [Thermomicrobiales bacterium]